MTKGSFETMIQLDECDFNDQALQEHSKAEVTICTVTRGRLSSFKEQIASLEDTCSDVSKVEILLKIDDDDNVAAYRKIVAQRKFKWKILTYPRYRGFWNIHLFYNDLARLAHGYYLWPFGDDCRVLHGDWLGSLLGTKGAFPDGIYCVEMPGDYRGEKSFPAVTKKWVDVLGHLSPVPEIDTWFLYIGKRIGRLVKSKSFSKLKFMHNLDHTWHGDDQWKRRKGYIHDLADKHIHDFYKAMK